MSGFYTEALSKEHERDQFACGVPALDEYLRFRASQDVRRYAAAVFVMVPVEEPRRIAGFYTLSAFSVRLTSVPDSVVKQLPRYPALPAILIGRLARSKDFPGLGALLLADAIARCVRQSDAVGASLIVVEAKNKAAKAFYESHGFLRTSDPMRLILSMKTAAQTANDSSSVT